MMPSYSPVAVANEFIKKGPKGIIPNQMKLQKLVHLANGWNLAINHEPLVGELPEAWDGGPVFRSIWNAVKSSGHRANDLLLRTPFGVPNVELTHNERKVIDHVWNKYNKYSGLELSEMTHRPGTPWTKTYFERGRNSLIPNDLMEKHYIELALAGRDR